MVDAVAEPCHVTPVTAAMDITVIDEPDLYVTVHTRRVSPEAAVTADPDRVVVVELPVSVVPSKDGEAGKAKAGLGMARAMTLIKSKVKTSRLFRRVLDSKTRLNSLFINTSPN